MPDYVDANIEARPLNPYQPGGNPDTNPGSGDLRLHFLDVAVLLKQQGELAKESSEIYDRLGKLFGKIADQSLRPVSEPEG